MVDAAIPAETLSAAPAAMDEAAQDAGMLSCMAGLAQDFARAFQAQGVVALAAGDLDRAGKCEAGFSRLFLGLRRAVALRAKLRRQREQQQRQAEDHRDGRQDGKDDRRRAVAEGLSRAIAAGKAEAKERLTVELWTRLTEDERIDADLADRALPIETLILRLGRVLGLSRRALGIGLGPEAKAATDPAGPKASAGRPFVPPAGYVPLFDPDEAPITESASYCGVPAADLGLPGDEPYEVRVDTGEVLDDDDNVIMRLPVPDEPWRAGAAEMTRLARIALAERAALAESAVPPEPEPPPPETDAERRRRERDEQLRLHGLSPHPS